jgi:hypothetical protein
MFHTFIPTCDHLLIACSDFLGHPFNVTSKERSEPGTLHTSIFLDVSVNEN